MCDFVFGIVFVSGRRLRVCFVEDLAVKWWSGVEFGYFRVSLVIVW